MVKESKENQFSGPENHINNAEPHFKTNFPKIVRFLSLKHSSNADSIKKPAWSCLVTDRVPEFWFFGYYPGKSLVQLSSCLLNPFLYDTSKTRVSGTHFVTKHASEYLYFLNKTRNPLHLLLAMCWLFTVTCKQTSHRRKYKRKIFFGLATKLI